MNGDAITLLLETFQELRRSGNQARLFLETRNGQQFGTLQIRTQVSKPGVGPSHSTPRKKAPSTVRRDQQRLRTFLQRKNLQESLGSPFASSTPVSRPGQSSSNQDQENSDSRVAMPGTPGILENDNPGSETNLAKQNLDQNTTDGDKEKEKNNSSSEITNKENVHLKHMTNEERKLFLKYLDRARIEFPIISDIIQADENAKTEEIKKDETLEDDIEGVTMWAKQQKLSLLKNNKK